MRPQKIWLIAGLYLALLLVPFKVIRGNVTLAGEVHGVLNPDLGAYPVTDNLLVPQGKTLTLEAGTELVFSPGVMLQVKGNLVIQGTDQDPVVLRAQNSESIWKGLTLLAGSDAKLNRMHITQTSQALSLFGDAEVSLVGGRVTKSRVGVMIEGNGSLQVTGTTFKNLEVGLDLTWAEGPINLESVFFEDLETPIQLSAKTNLQETKQVTFTNCQNPGLVLAGNPIQGPLELKSHTLPYLLESTLRITASGSLTMLPGVQILAAKNVALEVEGQLVVAGTEKNPVFLAARIAADYWAGIRFFHQGQADLTHLSIESADVGLFLDPLHENDLTASNLVISKCQTGLLHEGSGTVDLDGLQVFGGTWGLDLGAKGITKLTRSLFANQQRGPGVMDPAHHIIQDQVQGVHPENPGLLVRTGTLTGETLWSGKGLPLLIDDLIQVEQEATLTLEEGVRVWVSDSSAPLFEVAGVIHLKGTTALPITFEARQESWAGLLITGFIQAQHGHFNHADTGLHLALNGSGDIQKTSFKENQRAIFVDDNATFKMRSCLLALNEVGLDLISLYADIGGPSGDGKNDFVGNSEADVLWRGIGTQLAHGNWWGENPPNQDQLKTPNGGVIDLAQAPALPSMANLNPRFARGPGGAINVLWQDLGVELNLIVEVSGDPTFGEILDSVTVENGETVDTGEGDSGDVIYYRVNGSD